jgi:two-component system nitrogen regulation response regulator GlnG/two-component system response regulator HydG
VASNATLDPQELPWGPGDDRRAARLELVILWSLDEPHRVGESAAVDAKMVLGRGAPEPWAPHARFRPWRPGPLPPATALTSPRVSRAQLQLSPRGDHALRVENIGRNQLLVNGEERQSAEVEPGDTLTLRNALVLLVIRREADPPATPSPAFPFGQPDPWGMVGESAAAWQLRSELRFAAGHDHHVLLQGESGVGKEIAAAALHAMSRRGARALVSRNAATLPEGLVDAELFGTARNYPNVGSPERPGLIGEADGSTLFLDEIGELPAALQAHLLRVLDAGGAYQRLGDARPRRADLRVVAATNRPLDALKHDLAARFLSRVTLPGLNERREDIPLLLTAALAKAHAEHPDLVGRFFDAIGRPRLHPDLVEALVRHRYTLHVRELLRLLWQAIATSPADHLALTPEVRAELSLGSASPAASPPDREAIVAALAAANGRTAVAAAALGLSSRFALYRLMKRFGIAGGEG